MQPTRPLRAGLAVAVLACGACGDDSESAPAEDVAEAKQRIEVCPTDVVHGIDVSYYQGDIDWQAVAGAGYQFAIARINHSDFMDPKFDQNWAGIQSVGMLRGAYQYFEPGEDVAVQAQIVIDKLGMLAPGDLPAVIDVETTGGLPPAQVAQAVGEWLALVEAGTGKKPLIYTGKYFWQDNVASPDYAGYPLWHAQYPNACQPPASPPPACGCANIADQWSEMFMWQYSSSGSVPGIVGNVDLNVFNGTYAELVAFATQGGYGASLVSVDAPSTVLPGESFLARVTVENTGASPFDASTHLGTTEPRDRDSAFYDASWVSPDRPAVVSGVVNPGAEHTFQFTLRAPAELGTYTEHFGLVQEGVAWFADQGGPSDTTIALVVQVVATPGAGPGATGGGAGGGGGEGGAGQDDEGGDGCDCRSARSSRTAADTSWLILLCVATATRRRRGRRGD